MSRNGGAPLVYCVHPITGEACYKRRGKTGYCVIERTADVDKLNRELGVEPWQTAEALKILEMEYGTHDLAMLPNLRR